MVKVGDRQIEHHVLFRLLFGRRDQHGVCRVKSRLTLQQVRLRARSFARIRVVFQRCINARALFFDQYAFWLSQLSPVPAEKAACEMSLIYSATRS